MSTKTLVSLEVYLASSYEPDCDYVDGHIEERNLGEKPHGRLQARLIVALTPVLPPGTEVIPELRVQIKATRFRVPDVCVVERSDEAIATTPPLLCIEVLSPEDRMSRVEQRIKDYFEMGVPTVWVLDPETRQAYAATPAEGLREVKSGILGTQNPKLEVRLADLFR